MTANDLLSELRRRGIELVAAGDRLRYRPKDAVTPELREAILAHKAEIMRLLGDREPAFGSPDAAAAKLETLGPCQGPRFHPGCLFDYASGPRARPVLRCVAHPACPREVIMSWDGLLAEMFSTEKLVGAARRDGEKEWLARGGTRKASP